MGYRMNANSHTIIPDNEDHCVWMDAGLVNYKLCSCRFECETCPFDAVMREQHQTFEEQAAQQSGTVFPDRTAASSRAADNSVSAAGDVSDQIDRFLAPLLSHTFPQDRIYFSNHTWMRSMHDGTFMMGIDSVLAQLVYPVAGVATIHAPSHIGRGEPFAWIIRDSATFAVHNNEKGIVSRINARLMDHPSLLSADPYGDGWLIMLSGAEQIPASLKFYTADEFREFNLREVDDLAGELKKNRRSVGTTMFDGGTRIENIEKFIGEKRYNKIITRLLGPH